LPIYKTDGISNERPFQNIIHNVTIGALSEIITCDRILILKDN